MAQKLGLGKNIYKPVLSSVIYVTTWKKKSELRKEAFYRLFR